MSEIEWEIEAAKDELYRRIREWRDSKSDFGPDAPLVTPWAELVRAVHLLILEHRANQVRELTAELEAAELRAKDFEKIGWDGGLELRANQVRALTAELVAARADADRATQENERLREGILIIAEESPPDDWESYDSFSGYVGYGKRGDLAWVDSPDESNYDDVHAHGRATGAWDTAKRLRALASPAPESET